jgi:uncharacterized hydrophobic protein (TIGR00341 family)
VGVDAADVRLVHVTVPAGKRDAVTRTLDEQGVDYVLSDEVSGREYTAVATFPLPTEAVEPVLDELRAAGLDEEAFTVIVDARTVISRRFDQLQETYAEEESEERIAREELQAAAEGLAPSTHNYVALTVISVLIATAGILLDSAATVVGSMVIAPLIGPAMATSVGTVIDDRDLFARGLRLQVLGFAVAVAAAAAFAFLVRFGNLVPPGLDLLALGELDERVAPGFLTLVIALGAGAAGALSLRSGVSASLVGVMIAVALVPPAAVVGIGIAWGRPVIVLGAAVLVSINALSINLAALLVFWYSGYRPARWFQQDEAKNALLKRASILAVAILVLTAFLGGVTYSSFQTASAESRITATADGVIDRHEEVHRIEIRVESGDRPFDSSPDTVVVTAGIENGREPPDLATELAAELEYDVDVEVRLVTVQYPEG